MLTLFGMAKLTVTFDGSPLSPRERQIVGMLIMLQITTLRAPFIAAGHELSDEEERHILDDVALIMTAAFPDLLFVVEMAESLELPQGPGWPGLLRKRGRG